MAHGARAAIFLIMATCGHAPHNSAIVPTTAPIASPTPPPSTASTTPVTPPPASQPASPLDGSWSAPILLTLPAFVSADTSTSPTSDAASYAPCAPTISEGGPEIVYSFIAPADGTVTATLDDVTGDARDVDVQLLTAPSPTSCIARGNITLSHAVTAGTTYYLVVDTYENGSHAGAFTLTVALSVCPADMVSVAAPSGTVCVDRYEAPNLAGALPLVMYDFDESAKWCVARDKRLCFDDEWSYACGGADATTYPYGTTYDATQCNTDKTWVPYDQSRLNEWPAGATTPSVGDLQTLYANASPGNGAMAVAEVERLYQAEPSGSFSGCTNPLGAFDMVGSVEEWTRRRDGGTVTEGVHFSGNLKGRYWAEARTCFGGVTTHADPFRFYEIGFRCCMTP